MSNRTHQRVQFTSTEVAQNTQNWVFNSRMFVFLITVRSGHLECSSPPPPSHLPSVLPFLPHRYLNSGSAPLECDKEFWDLRDSVVQCELLILRQLNFQVSFEHPHKVGVCARSCWCTWAYSCPPYLVFILLVCRCYCLMLSWLSKCVCVYSCCTKKCFQIVVKQQHFPWQIWCHVAFLFSLFNHLTLPFSDPSKSQEQVTEKSIRMTLLTCDWLITVAHFIN